MAGLSDDLLAEHRPAAAFDEVQLGANLVGAIDGDVNLSGKIISQQGNAELLCRDGRRRRRWHSHDVVEQAVAQQVSKATCRVIAVLPVPSPTIMPEETNSSARSAAWCLYCSIMADLAVVVFTADRARPIHPVADVAAGQPWLLPRCAT